MVFHLWKEHHRRRLRKALEFLDTLLLMHAPFDISFLRAWPEFRFVLDGSHTLIDLAVVNYLHDETRPERGLKSLGPVLRTHSYKLEHTLKHRRFPHPLWIGPEGEGLCPYNGQDSHNTLLDIAELSRRISAEWPDTDKLSNDCVRDYSDRLWTSIAMSEAGVCMSRSGLTLLERGMILRMYTASIRALQDFHLTLEGEGSVASKDCFLELACDCADGWRPTRQRFKECMQQGIHPTDYPNRTGNIRDNPLLELTPKQRKISFKDANRNLIREHIPENTYLADAFRDIDEHQHAQKLIGSYCYPLLRYRRNHHADRSSCLIPTHGPLPIPDDLTTLARPTSPPSNNSEDPSTSESTSRPSSATAATSNSDSTAPSTSAPPTGRPQPISVTRSTRSPGPWVVYPTWYVTPGPQKDDQGATGGTIQGRITAKGPAVQTFPPEVDAYLSSRFEDGVIFSFDLSQIELRVAALLSGDAYMLRAYQEGRDLHSSRACQIWGDGIQNERDFRAVYRDCAKHVNFGDLFLAAPDTLQATVLRMTGQHFPIDIFHRIVQDRPTQRPGLCAWQREEISYAQQHGHCRALPFTGQTRWVRGGDKDPRSEVVNFPIQTTAGNVLLRIQARLLPHMQHQNPRHPWVYMTMNRYDAAYFDVQRDHVEQLTHLIESAVATVGAVGYWQQLQGHYGREVPLEYDVELKEPAHDTLRARADVELPF
jgi:hypothetical protein